MPNSINAAQDALKQARQSADWAGLRYSHETTRRREVRNDRPEKNESTLDEGVMCEVLVDGHFGYAASADVSAAGLKRAFERAIATSRAASGHKAHSFSLSARPQAQGQYQSPYQKKLDDTTLTEITDCLLAASRAMQVSDLLVNRSACATTIQTRIDCFSSNGSDTRQSFDMVDIELAATAVQGVQSQSRSWSHTGQFGGEAFQCQTFAEQARRIAGEALELLAAPNCPSGRMDLILLPDQMMLQIHESIGHPLELDRILGDERNYAGWSFVKPTDFGRLQYGSALMNITFDPTKTGSLASYAFDDGGNPARREFLIEKGVLKRGLGSLESQQRSGLPGVANVRSASWNRAPIDRMANINLEAGTSTLQELIGSVESGILMSTNRSWSIDDYRNKFQFGCERGQLIKDGQLGPMVRNPNYRGVTVDFWNRLAGVGREVSTYGTRFCGKGEPNQVIRVGHSSPACLFRGVEVFGGQS
jgi:predicted Zn-dependent protease